MLEGVETRAGFVELAKLYRQREALAERDRVLAAREGRCISAGLKSSLELVAGLNSSFYAGDTLGDLDPEAQADLRAIADALVHERFRMAARATADLLRGHRTAPVTIRVYSVGGEAQVEVQ